MEKRQPGITPEEARLGACLTQGLMNLAAEYAREHGLSDTVVVAALSSSLGCVAAAMVRANAYKRAGFEAVICNHVAGVFRAELERVAVH